MQKECKNCKKVFQKKATTSLHEWNTTVKFCSIACHNDYRRGKPSPSPLTTFKKGNTTFSFWDGRKKRYGEENNKWKGGAIKKNCLICSKSFTVWRDRLDAKTCSVSCRQLYEKTEEARMIRSKSHRTLLLPKLYDSKELRRLLRVCSRYAIWREKVLKKDDYTCQGCGKRGGKIQADHIKPFAQIILENKIETYEQAVMCEELWDVENGQTLCLPCHYKSPTFGSKVLTLLANTKIS